MKVEIKGNRCYVAREPGDRKYHNSGWGACGCQGESQLLYHIQQVLNARGYNLAKQRMWRDGHLVDDSQQYLKPRKPSGDPDKDIYIYNDYWAIEGAEEQYNSPDGKTSLAVIFDVFA